MEKKLEADSLFQVLLRIFYVLLGIESKSQIKTELKEILAKSVRIDALVSFPDNFDFTNLLFLRVFSKLLLQSPPPSFPARLKSTTPP